MNPPYNNEERRFALRMALRLPIVISGRAEDGSAWSEPTETDDISTSGALFHLNQKVSRGERLYLRAHRPDCGICRKLVTPLRLLGRRRTTSSRARRFRKLAVRIARIYLPVSFEACRCVTASQRASEILTNRSHRNRAPDFMRT